MELNITGSILNFQNSPNGWLDLYALLDLPGDTTEEVIRKRISVLYSEAVSNYNHRDSKRRESYQLMGQQVLPQCRRVLLNPAFRARYDAEQARHATGAANALSYKAFLGTLADDGLAGLIGDAETVPGNSVPETNAAPIATMETSAVRPPVWPPVVETQTVAASAAAPVSDTTKVETQAAPLAPRAMQSGSSDDEDNTPVMPVITNDRPLLTAIEVPETAKSVTSSARNKPAKPMPAVKSKAALKPARQDAVAAFPTTPVATGENASRHTLITDKPKRSLYVPRVMIGENVDGKASHSALVKPGERALSDTSIALLTAIVATMLSITIDLYSLPGEFAISTLLFVAFPHLRVRAFISDTQQES